MSHYEERLASDIKKIKEHFQSTCSLVERGLDQSIHALLSGDDKLAYETALGDMPINRSVREMDRLCHAFVARHLPSAGHLRFISSLLKLNQEIERIGDYAVTICRASVRLSKHAPETVARDIELISHQARRVLSQAITAFLDENPEMAQGSMGMAEQVNDTYTKVFRDLLREGDKHKRPLEDLFTLLIIFNRISRVSDRAKNICEETVFAYTGETKASKVYRILFIDEKNDCASLIAEAIARRAFPESGEYSSAGWAPAESLAPGVAEQIQSKGLDLAALEPSPLVASYDFLVDTHVIVSLGGDARKHLEEIPFKTIYLEWDLGTYDKNEDLSPLFQGLSTKINALMETLQGPGAG